jgi:hypothetical protein
MVRVEATCAASRNFFHDADGLGLSGQPYNPSASARPAAAALPNPLCCLTRVSNVTGCDLTAKQPVQIAPFLSHLAQTLPFVSHTHIQHAIKDGCIPRR